MNIKRLIMGMGAILILCGLAFLILRAPAKTTPAIAQKLASEQKRSASHVSKQATELPATQESATSSAKEAITQTATTSQTPQSWLEGQVVDLSDRGIPGARLNASYLVRDYKEQPFLTDEGGYFKIPEPSHMPFFLHVSASGFVSRNLRFPNPDENPENQIRLSPGGDLELYVVDEDDQPIANATVFQVLIGEQKTNASGFVKLERVSDPSNLYIRAKGYNPHRATFPLDSAEKTVTLLENGAIHGLVVDAKDGTPIPEFSIEIRSPMSTHPQVTDFEDTEGRFEITDLSRKQLKYRFYAPGYLPKMVTLKTCLPLNRSNPIEVRMTDQGIHFSGKVEDQTGNPIPGAVVTAFLGEPIDTGQPPFGIFPRKVDGDWYLDHSRFLDIRTARSDAVGHFEIGPLPSASYLTFVTEADGFVSKLTMQLETRLESERDNLIITLENFGKILLTVGQKDYPGKRKIRVYSEVSQTNAFYELLPGEEDLILEHVPPGRTTLSLNEYSHLLPPSEKLPKILPDEKNLVVASGETYQLEIGTSVALELGGRILLDGIPMANRRVTLDNATGLSTTRYVTTNSEGFFTFSPLEPGTYEIKANGSNEDLIFGKANRAIIDLKSDKTDLFFDFPTMGSVFGRILSKPADTMLHMDLVYATGERSRTFSKKNTRLRVDGTFVFTNVPPGSFSLSVQKPFPKQARLLLKDQIMPDDGSDLDLGDLKEGEGKVRLELKGHLAQKKAVYVNVNKVPVNDQEGDTVPLTQLTTEQPNELLEGLDLGPIRLVASVNEGFRLQPSEHLLQLTEDQAALATFQVIAETYFAVNNIDSSRDLNFTWAQLRNESNGKAWVLPTIDAAPKPVQGNQPYLYFTRYSAVGYRLPEGWWQIKIINKSGGSVTRRFQLVRGIPTSIELRPSDYKKPD